MTEGALGVSRSVLSSRNNNKQVMYFGYANPIVILQLLMQLFACRRQLLDMQRRSRVRRAKRLLTFRKRQSENFLRGLTLLTALPDGRSGRVWQVPKSTNWWDIIVPNWNQSQWLENFRMKRHTFQVINKHQTLQIMFLTSTATGNFDICVCFCYHYHFLCIIII